MVPITRARARLATQLAVMARPQASSGSIGAAGYRVRLCDSRFFPMQRHTAVSVVELCNAFCPTSATKVFLGTNLSHAVAVDGSCYGSLVNALAMRKTQVPNCTSNGKDHFGLAQIDANTDPTLCASDMVATASSRMITASSRADRTRPVANVS